MLDAGLRVSEALSLRWENVDLMTGKLMVKEGKGAKDRTLWLGEADLELLRRWRERQAGDVKGNPEHGRIFESHLRSCSDDGRILGERGFYILLVPAGSMVSF